VKPGGILLALAGVWVLCQVLGGGALDRLGITGTTIDLGQGTFAPHSGGTKK
jgi:hypothetical protein